MAKWMVSAKKADFGLLADTFHISPVTARLLRNRDLLNEEEIAAYLSGSLSSCHDPFLLPDVEKGARLTADAQAAGEKILIVGDYDVDGICATALLMRGLRTPGARVSFRIPHRVHDGYGISTAIVEEAREQGISLILTCDNGIAAREQTLLAHSYGMRVVITDHHEIPLDADSGGAMLPSADAVIDPCRKDTGQSYPFAGICGTVVAYKFLQVLFTLTGQEERFSELQGAMVELCALATVCDVMDLKDENRILVREGMRRMRDSAIPGLKSLIGVTGLAGQDITTTMLGFVLGPCLNASGRLDDATRAVGLFLNEDEAQAVREAQLLKDLNESRKQMTTRYTQQAIEQIEGTQGELPGILVAYLEDAHESVAGIVAGRLREHYARPAIVLTKGEEGIKGSARSVPACDIFRTMTACEKLLQKYGGHPLACGMTLKEGVTPQMLLRSLNEACTLTSEDLEEVLHLDMELAPSYLTIPLVEEWNRVLAPFGNGNARPLFAARNIRLLGARALGRDGRVGKYRVRDEEGTVADMLLFRGKDRFDAFLKEHFGEEALHAVCNGRGEDVSVTIKIAYTPDINEYRGERKLQLILEDYMI
ncbi:MAG: single-stranded-DNA-specific exonuclease RecJ [Lachnospiraceae bacterium]|nr:single-stranded-DNA-specific exonuclease RecJ [Lachnospiraceae bacterium]